MSSYLNSNVNCRHRRRCSIHFTVIPIDQPQSFIVVGYFFLNMISIFFFLAFHHFTALNETTKKRNSFNCVDRTSVCVISVFFFTYFVRLSAIEINRNCGKKTRLMWSLLFAWMKMRWTMYFWLQSGGFTMTRRTERETDKEISDHVFLLAYGRVSSLKCSYLHFYWHPYALSCHKSLTTKLHGVDLTKGSQTDHLNPIKF